MIVESKKQFDAPRCWAAGPFERLTANRAAAGRECGGVLARLPRSLLLLPLRRTTSGSPSSPPHHLHILVVVAFLHQQPLLSSLSLYLLQHPPLLFVVVVVVYDRKRSLYPPTVFYRRLSLPHAATMQFSRASALAAIVGAATVSAQSEYMRTSSSGVELEKLGRQAAERGSSDRVMGNYGSCRQGLSYRHVT